MITRRCFCSVRSTGISGLETYTSSLTIENFDRKLEKKPPMVIEYSSPNIAKPLHLGHLRSTITGKFVSNIIKFAGHKVTDVCLLGDWGRQFGVLQAGIQHRNVDYKTLSLSDLLNVYVESSRAAEHPEYESTVMMYTRSLEAFEPHSVDVWEHAKSVSLDHLYPVYKDLNVSFDVMESESTFHMGSDHVATALKTIPTFVHGGATCCRVNGKIVVLVKSDNCGVYLIRDVACLLNRKRLYPGHKYVYVVDNSQKDHFNNLFGIVNADCLHVGFGKVANMSTRSGKFVLLSDVIAQGTELMHHTRTLSKNARDTSLGVSKTIAINSLVFELLKVKRNKIVEFDWEKALTWKRDKCVSLLHTIVRIRRIVAQAQFEPVPVPALVQFCNGNQLLNDLMATLLRFETAYWTSYESLEPCVLVNYALEISSKVSRCVGAFKVNQSADAAYLQSLFCVTDKVLTVCTDVVGIEIPPNGI